MAVIECNVAYCVAQTMLAGSCLPRIFYAQSLNRRLPALEVVQNPLLASHQPLPQPMLPIRIRLAPNLDAGLRSLRRDLFLYRSVKVHRWGVCLCVFVAVAYKIDRVSDG